jgi:propanol-preferring alcohol dehydrogenase
MQIHETGRLTSAYSGLRLKKVPIPEPGLGEVLLKIEACGVCHTEVDEIENRAPPSSLPMIPGHQVVGTIVAAPGNYSGDQIGRRVGVAWIHSACGHCGYCNRGYENLCSRFVACGRDHAGGYAEYMTVPLKFVHMIPSSIATIEAAPLLCAGAVGYRALKLSGLQNGEALGLTGFGSSGRLVLQMARHLFPLSPIFVFARSEAEQKIALELGAVWAGHTTDRPTQELNAIIDSTPAWLPIVSALATLAPAGRLVINAIRKEEDDKGALGRLDYAKHLWQEKSIKSVSNVTREDVRSMLDLATQASLQSGIVQYPLERAQEALLAIKSGQIEGTGVLVIGASGQHN